MNNQGRDVGTSGFRCFVLAFGPFGGPGIRRGLTGVPKVSTQGLFFKDLHELHLQDVSGVRNVINFGVHTLKGEFQ